MSRQTFTTGCLNIFLSRQGSCSISRRLLASSTRLAAWISWGLSLDIRTLPPSVVPLYVFPILLLSARLTPSCAHSLSEIYDGWERAYTEERGGHTTKRKRMERDGHMACRRNPPILHSQCHTQHTTNASRTRPLLMRDGEKKWETALWGVENILCVLVRRMRCMRRCKEKERKTARNITTQK